MSVPKPLLAIALAVLAGMFVEGATRYDVKVQCKKSGKCVGTRSVYSPSLDVGDNGQVYFTGGYGWALSLVEGLEDGKEDYDTIHDNLTGDVVRITVNADKTTCSMSVNEEDCRSCSAEGCVIESIFQGEEEGEINQSAVKFDCTNLEQGTRSDECVLLDPFLWPIRSRDGGGGGGGMKMNMKLKKKMMKMMKMMGTKMNMMNMGTDTMRRRPDNTKREDIVL